MRNFGKYMLAVIVLVVLAEVFAGNTDKAEDSKEAEVEVRQEEQIEMEGEDQIETEVEDQIEVEAEEQIDAELLLEYTDFNVYDTDIQNIVDYYQEYGVFEGANGYIYYYDPILDDSKNGIVRTQRGIQIGDSQNAVVQAYGKGKNGKITDDNWLFDGLDESTGNVLRETCVEYRQYEAEDIGTITFYFDSEDEVTCVSYIINENYGERIEVTEEEIKELCGTYIREDEKYELVIKTDENNSVCVEIIKSENVVLHCSESYVGPLPNGIIIYAEDDDNYERVEIIVVKDSSMWISYESSKFFGHYIRK